MQTTRHRILVAVARPIAVLLFLIVVSGAAFAKRPSFSVSVSPEEIAMGDSVVVTIKIELAGIEGPNRYWAPKTPEFRLIDSQVKRSTESRMDATSGQELMTVWVYRYVLAPQTTGRLSIGPAKIRVGRDEWETRERFVRVRVGTGLQTKALAIGKTTASALNAPGYVPPQGPHDDVFLYAVCDKSGAWVGEQFTVSWLLFARSEVLKYEPTPPALAHLWSETLFEPKAFLDYSDARIGAKDYVVALVSKRAFFARKAGVLKISPLIANIATVTSSTNMSQWISSNTIQLTIKKLPRPAPPGFDASYVGEFSLQSSVDRNLLPAGEPLTLSLKVSGIGALRQIRAPQLRLPNFSYEAPTDVRDEIRLRGDQVAGERTYHYWMTPIRGGEQSIPPISLAYFSPSHGRYETMQTRAIGITVQGDPQAEQAKKEAQRRTMMASAKRSIRLLHDTDEVHSRLLVDFYRQRWFWLLLLLPPLGLVLAVGGELLRNRWQADTPRTRLRRARAAANLHVKRAATHLRDERSSECFGELSQAVYAHLDALFALRLRSLTREQLAEILRDQGVSTVTSAQLLDDLDAFDRERFVPSVTPQDDMREAITSTKLLLRRVELECRQTTSRAGSATVQRKGNLS